MVRALALGLDIGTSRIKACVVDAEGAMRATSAVVTPFHETPDGVEMSPDALFHAVRRCLLGLGERLAEVVAVGIATMGETGGMVAGGQVAPVPLLAWYDPRGAGTVERLLRAFPGDLRARTGRRIRTVSSVAKLGWLAGNGVDLSGEWTGIGGLIAWRLTGKVAQEESLAVSSGAFDPFSGDWDRDIIAEAGLSRVRWPEVMSAIEPVGHVTTEGSAWSGLPAGVPVCIAGHDHPVGVVGVGAQPTDIVDSMGTGEPLVTGWNGDGGAFESLVAELPVDGELTVTRWPGGSGLMMLWEVLRPGLARMHASRALGMSQELLDDEALQADAGFPPLASATLRELEDREPVGLDDAGAAAAAQYWRAMLAGYAASAAQSEAWIRSNEDRGETLLIGGGLRSAAWVREKVVRARREPLVVSQPESVAYGAALLGAVSAGFWPSRGLPRAARHEVSTVLPADVCQRCQGL